MSIRFALEIDVEVSEVGGRLSGEEVTNRRSAQLNRPKSE